MKRLIAAATLAVAMLGGGVGLAPAALAHSELVSTTPEDGATLDSPPTSVTFTFNEDLLPDFVRLIAKNPAGVTGDLPITSVEGPTVTADWPAAEGGEWTVSYRVVSQDGHPVEGSITFAYEGAAPTSSGPAPTSASPTTPAPTSASATTPAPTSAEPSPSLTPAADTTSSGIGSWAIAGIAIVLIAVVGVVLALVMRRRT